MENKNNFFYFIAIIFAFFVFLGFKKHERNKDSVISVSQRILKNNGFTQFNIDDVNLPLNYTILNQKVKSTIFIKKNNKIKLLEVFSIQNFGNFVCKICQNSITASPFKT